MGSNEILTSIAIAVSGWIAINMVAVKEKLARLETRIDTLPCGESKSGCLKRNQED